MASYIEFTDDESTEQLSNGYPAPGDRFNAWQMMSPIVGPEDEGLGTGTLYKWEFRADYGASFELNHIPQDQVAVAMRLIRHLNRAGEVTVVTGDAGGREYTCQKWKGVEPELGKPDKQNLRRTLKLTLRNTEAADMIVVWP
jgi:hypothetical protein